MNAIRMKTTVKLCASGECPAHARSDISIRDVTFSIDEPTERGETNQGPTSTDTALASLIGRTNVEGSRCADTLGIDIGHPSISRSSDFDRRGVTLSEEIDVPFQNIKLIVKVSGLANQGELDKLADAVAKYCPPSILLEQAGTRINSTWHPA